jgi:hypothetical protein
MNAVFSSIPVPDIEVLSNTFRERDLENSKYIVEIIPMNPTSGKILRLPMDSVHKIHTWMTSYPDYTYLRTIGRVFYFIQTLPKD